MIYKIPWYLHNIRNGCSKTFRGKLLKDPVLFLNFCKLLQSMRNCFEMQSPERTKTFKQVIHKVRKIPSKTFYATNVAGIFL